MHAGLGGQRLHQRVLAGAREHKGSRAGILRNARNGFEAILAPPFGRGLPGAVRDHAHAASGHARRVRGALELGGEAR